jgi:DNA-binding Lrp family transcriptional regulator
MMPTAYVLINTNPGAETGLLGELRKMPAVRDARVVMGEYDVLATLDCNTMRELKECINLKVRYLDDIVSTNTLMAVNA